MTNPTSAFRNSAGTTFNAFGVQARHDGATAANTLATGPQTAFDALGYNAIPEPSAALLSIPGFMAIGARRSCRQA